MNQTFSENSPIDCPLTLRTFLVQQERSQQYGDFLIFSIVLNTIIAISASVSNAVVIYTISFTPSLRLIPSNILILGLALSDFAASVLSQSLYCFLLTAELRHDLTLICPASTAHFVTVWTFVSISFLTLIAISGDRYLALKLHLRYRAVITSRRYMFVLASIWIVGSGVGILRNYTPLLHGLEKIVFGFFAVLFVSLVLLKIFFISKINTVLHKHSVQIQAQQLNMNMPRFKRSVHTIYYVIGTFIFCYVPYVVLLAIARVSRFKPRTERMAYLYTVAETLVLLNGVLNPVIYCWRITEIRQAALHCLKKRFRRRHGNEIRTSGKRKNRTNLNSMLNCEDHLTSAKCDVAMSKRFDSNSNKQTKIKHQSKI